MEQKKKQERYSYSRLNTYKGCGFKYNLQYNLGHFINSDSLASELGTLIHYINEHIAIALINGDPINYEKLKEDFHSINVPKISKTEGGIYGIDILKEKYHEEFYKINEKNGESYFTKCKAFEEKGIYRLENFIKTNPNISILAVEQYFSVEYKGVVFSGFIDRLMFDHAKNVFIVDDIKTKDHGFSDKDLVTPLQFVIYCLAVKSMKSLKSFDEIECYYDLPIADLRQRGGTKGFMERGLKKIDEILAKIKNGEFAPRPSPLCYWCQYSHTNPLQPEEGKNLCCYYSLWKPDNKTYDVMNKWEGPENHEKVLAHFKNEQQAPGKNINDPITFDFDF